MGWVVNATPRPLYPRERPGTLCMGGWVGSRAGLDNNNNNNVIFYKVVPDVYLFIPHLITRSWVPHTAHTLSPFPPSLFKGLMETNYVSGSIFSLHAPLPPAQSAVPRAAGAVMPTLIRHEVYATSSYPHKTLHMQTLYSAHSDRIRFRRDDIII